MYAPAESSSPSRAVILAATSETVIPRTVDGLWNVPARTAGWFASTYWNSEAARRIARDAPPSRTRVSPANPPWRRVRLASVHRFCGSLTHGHASAAPRRITGSRACPSYPANVRARSANRASVRVASAQSISGTAPTTRTSRDRRGGRRSGTSASTSGETASKTRAVTASRRASSDASSETSRRSPENDAGARREEDASASSSSAPTSDVSRTDRGTERAARRASAGFREVDARLRRARGVPARASATPIRMSPRRVRPGTRVDTRARLSARRLSRGNQSLRQNADATGAFQTEATRLNARGDRGI